MDRKMQKITYKFRLYPNKDQEEKLLWALEKCRLVYNDMLAGLNGQRKPNRMKLQAMLPELKKQYPELTGVYSKVLQYEPYRLFSNLKALGKMKKKGRKVGRLRFKGRGWFKTFTYNQSGFRIIKTNTRLDKLHLSKIGDIPIRLHRRVEGNVKQITIKKHCSGKWYACIIVVQDAQVQQVQQIKRPVGLDVGIKYFLSDSNGIHVENPKYLNETLKRLRREQRRLSQKEKKSKNRNKQRGKVVRLYERIYNQRNDFLHKLSRNYVDSHDFMVIEGLNIKGMVKNHHLARYISDASWGSFFQMLSYKAENAGKIVMKVDPRGTSQEHKYGEDLDRDYNASINILQRGLEKLPQGLREVFTPVEIKPLRKPQLVSASSVIEAGSLFQNHR